MFRPELVPKIAKEADKLIEIGFIREVRYNTWIANIILVRKKSGRTHICVDVQDLNGTFPKHDFLLLVIELMIDSIIRHEGLSFIDCTTRYN